jgi:hypothetical protein
MVCGYGITPIPGKDAASMSKSFYDAHLKALEFVSVTHSVYIFLAACPANPRRAIEEWAKLHFMLLPPNRDNSFTANGYVAQYNPDPGRIPLLESIAMKARGNTEFQWGKRTFTCAHDAAEKLAHEIDNAVSSSTSLRPGFVIVIREPPPNYPNASVDEWKAAYVQDAQLSGLLNAHGEPTDKWPMFVEMFQHRTMGLIWPGSEEKLKVALRLEYNAARHASEASVVMEQFAHGTADVDQEQLRAFIDATRGKKTRKMLDFLFDNGALPKRLIRDTMNAAGYQPASPTARVAFDKLVERANAPLPEQNIPWTIKVSGETIFLIRL